VLLDIFNRFLVPQIYTGPNILKEKEVKTDAKTLVLLFLVLTGPRERSVRFIEKGSLLRHHTG
jgi:hypothetical protein